MKNKKELAIKIIKILDKEYKDIDIALHYNSVFELLVATILSAQCTDEQVNKATPALFAKYKTIAYYAKADISDIETLVHSTGFFRNKSKNIDIKITIHEGRNRQIRKMLEAVGEKVLALKRISIGELTLGMLKVGQFRELSPKEVAYLKML
jgi:endonuclease III